MWILDDGFPPRNMHALRKEHRIVITTSTVTKVRSLTRGKGNPVLSMYSLLALISPLLWALCARMRCIRRGTILLNLEADTFNIH